VPRRLKKVLKRVVLALLLLLVLGVAAFTWLCYWPLEGDHDDLMALVPYGVDFVLRTSWEDVAESRWVEQNVVDRPFLPSIGRELDAALPDVRRRIAEIEEQINANIPIASLRFSFAKDVLEGEIAVAGNLCRGLGPEQGLPKWHEILVLTRVSWKTRCIAALKHGFVRDNLGPQLRIEESEDDVFKIHLTQVRASPVELRSGCGSNVIVPPENEWYLRRCKGVLAISNSPTLIRQVAENSHEDISRTQAFPSRRGYDTRWTAGSRRIVAAVDLEPLRNYLVRTFEHLPASKPLRRFLVPQSLFKLNGSLALGGSTLLTGGGRIEFDESSAGDSVRHVYSLGPRSMREGIAQFVPARDTFLVAMIRGEPKYLMRGLVDDLLTPKQRALWRDNLVQSGRFTSLEEFVDELATKVGDTLTLAVGRLSHVFDKAEYPTYFVEDLTPDPMEALAVMVKIAESATPAEVDEYLASVVPTLGFKPELVRVPYHGFTYSRCELQQEMGDYALASPCFLLAQNHLVLTNNEDYMRQILDTLQDPESLSLDKDDAFRETLAQLPDEMHLGLFVDLEKLTRVPPTSEPGGQPRGLLWDRRRLWVLENHSDIAAVQAERERLKRESPNLSPEELNRRVDEYAVFFQTIEYPRFVEEWRRTLEGWRRLRALGVGLARVSERDLDARFALLLREGDSPGDGTGD
jgi:hypothetical protein